MCDKFTEFQMFQILISILDPYIMRIRPVYIRISKVHGAVHSLLFNLFTYVFAMAVLDVNTDTDRMYPCY